MYAGKRAVRRNHHRPDERFQAPTARPPRCRDEANGAAKCVRVGKINLADARDALDRNLADFDRLPEGNHGEDGDFIPGVVALDVHGGVGLGVARSLCLAQSLAERAATLLHLRQDVIGGAVEDAVNRAEVLPRKPFADGVKNGHSAGHAGFDAE